MAYRLGVDLGTTFTSAAVFESGWPAMVGLGNRAMQIPSVLFLKPDGEFLVGEAAERRGASEPDRIAREFKRRLGDQVPILVAGSPHSPQSLQARLLVWVVDQVGQRQGSPPDHITLTYPANWGPFKQDLFAQTIRLADISGADVCTEPEAAATLYAARNVMATGECVAVYDLGGGTFDATIFRKTESGFVLLGQPEGIEHLGGVDFDEAVFQHVLAGLGEQVALLPDDAALIAGLARLRRDCVEAKEALSGDTETVIPVTLPGLTTSVRLVRDEFEEMIRPSIADTLGAMRRVIRSAHIEPADLSAIILCGGSSRIPLVSQALWREFDRPLALDTHPKHDVAMGAALYGAGLPASDPSTEPRPVTGDPPPPTTPTPADPEPEREPEPKKVRRRRPAILRLPGLAALAAVLIVAAAIALFIRHDASGGAGPQGGGHPSGTVTSTSTATTPAPVRLPDSTLLVTSASKGLTTMYQIDVDSGKAEVIPLPQAPAGDPQPRLPTISPDRLSFVYLLVPPGAAGGVPWLRTFNGSYDKPLFTSKSPCTVTGRPAFSPNGKQLAVVCPDKTSSTGKYGLFVIDLQGNLVRTLVTDATLTGSPTWTKRGRIIFQEVSSTGLEKLSGIASDGPLNSETTLTTGTNADDSHEDFSTTHGLLFLRTTDGKGDIWVRDLETGKAAPITDTGDVDSPCWSADGKQIAFLRTNSDGSDTLMIVDADGKTDLSAVPWPKGAGQPGPPAWDSR